MIFKLINKICFSSEMNHFHCRETNKHSCFTCNVSVNFRPNKDKQSSYVYEHFLMFIDLRPVTFWFKSDSHSPLKSPEKTNAICGSIMSIKVTFTHNNWQLNWKKCDQVKERKCVFSLRAIWHFSFLPHFNAFIWAEAG